MNDLKCLIIFLSQFDLTNAKIGQILEELGNNQSIAGFKKSKLVKNGVLTKEAFDKMIEVANDGFVRTYLLNLQNRGINVVTKFDDDYPEKLFELYDAPYILFYMGDLNLVNQPSLAVVGSRKPTSYGKVITERFVRDIASTGVVIISGLAFGVDSIAHRVCLDTGGKTIAVLGGGFDHIYPQEHHNLAMEIAEKGLIISEFRPKKTATKYSFPQRNRIIAGLSDGVLITEASIKSGTIHTKEFALEYGKNIYAVPGNIDNINSELTNDIIKTCQAECVTKSDDILKDYSLTKSDKKEQISMFEGVNEDEKILLNHLKNGMKSIDDLTKECKMSINIFNTCLTTLEIRVIIKRMPGGCVALS